MSRILKIICISLFSFSLCFLFIGYASLVDDLKLEGNLSGTPQEGLFITDFITNNDSKVNSYSFVSSLLTSDITLDSIDQEVTYTIEMYNSNDEPYCFIGTKYSGVYTNSNIDFSLTIEDNEGDWITDTDTSNYSNSKSVIPAKDYQSFTITFKHNGTGANLNLSSVIQFLFIPVKDAQVVTLIYDNDTYRDCFRKTKSYATFQNLTFETSTTNNNVARCNLNANFELKTKQELVNLDDDEINVLNDESKTVMTIQNVYTTEYKEESSSSVTVNNDNNSVKCEVYDSLTASLGDEEFEKNNYTTNNFIVLNDVIENNTSTANVPENQEFNVDLNKKTIEYYPNTKMIVIKNESVVNLKNCGEITCGGNVTSFVEIDHQNAILNVYGGKIVCQSSGEIFNTIQGKLIIKGSELETKASKGGNVFRVGLEPTEEESKGVGITNLHVEFIGGSAKSTSANIVHSTSRQKVLFSFVNVNLKAGNNIILCNNKGFASTLTEPSEDVWKNVKFYITGGTISAPKFEFATSGARLFYTNSIEYIESQNGMRVLRGGNIETATVEHYAVKNFTTLTTEDWYLIKDQNGNQVYGLFKTKDSEGNTIYVEKPVMVGSCIVLKINSGTSTSYVLDVPAADYIESKTLQIYTSNNSNAQCWMFLASSDTGFYNIVPYYYPTLMLYMHPNAEHTSTKIGRRVDLQYVDLQYDQTPTGTNFQAKPGSRFTFYYQSSSGKYTLDSKVTADCNNQSKDKLLSLDVYGVNNGYANNKVIHCYEHNNSNAQIWNLLWIF